MNKIIFISLMIAVLILAIVFIARSKKPLPDREILIVAFGDSLTEGYGVSPEYTYPSRLEKKLQTDSVKAKVINMGVSGDTSGDALERIDEIIEPGPDIVVLAIGSNDGLRSGDLEITKDNISKIINKLKTNNIRIVFCGMRLSLIKGFKYSSKFKEMYAELAGEHDLIFMPFFLEDVLLKPKYNIEDNIHPNKDGYKIITDNLYPFVLKAMKNL